MSKLHFIELKGSSRQRGQQHGRLLRAPIAKAVEFYRWFFRRHLGLEPEALSQRAAAFIEPTHRLSPLLFDEYEGIAEGSGQTLEDILVLSARYEITFETVALGDCSNLFVGPERSQSGNTLLGQSWDWRPEVMDFRAVFVARCDDVPDHIMVTECGQPGKYGLNQHGLGLVAAGLRCREKASIGDQLFVVLGREILAQETLAQACEVMTESAPLATVNVLVADDRGRAVNFESAPERIVRASLEPAQVYWHTNHCLQEDEPCTFENSRIRGLRWAQLTEGVSSVTPEMVQTWLADRSDGGNSICQHADPSQANTASWLQTLCSIVMDLGRQTLWVSDGPSSQNDYQEVGFRTRWVAEVR